jgi:RNA recognition motif-containing protein
MTLKNIYVGNLSFETSSDNLKDIFSEYGQVDRAQVATDRDTGRSRGFGFVEMRDGGDEAIAALNGAEYQGRTMKVNEARPREDRPRHTSGARNRY